MKRATSASSGGGGGGSFTANAVTFDGTNDYLSRALAAFTGAVDSKTFTLSCWLKFNGGDAAEQIVILFGGQAFQFSRTTGNKLNFLGRNGGGTAIVNVTSAGSLVAATGWVHVLVSCDTATSTFQLYLNDASDARTVTTLTANGLFDWDVGGAATQYFGSNTVAESLLNATVAEFYLHTDTALDISVAGNRAKFYSGGHPVDLGADGSTPTGTQPLIYLKNAAASYATNAGKGGNFVLTGTLVDATPP